MKKKMLALVLSAAMIVGMTACGNSNTETPSSEAPAASSEVAS